MVATVSPSASIMHRCSLTRRNLHHIKSRQKAAAKLICLTGSDLRMGTIDKPIKEHELCFVYPIEIYVEEQTIGGKLFFLPSIDVSYDIRWFVEFIPQAPVHRFSWEEEDDFYPQRLWQTVLGRPDLEEPCTILAIINKPGVIELFAGL